MIFELITTFLVIIMSICMIAYRSHFKRVARELKEARHSMSEMKTELDKLRNSVVSNDFKCFDGVFEIHITVDPELNYVKLLDYVKQHEKQKGMKIVYAVSSKKNNQYMLSYFTRKTDDQMAVDAANEIASELTTIGVKVLRVKVEGHNCTGTPQTTKDYNVVREYLQNKYHGKAGSPYFEFHVKVANATDISDLEKEVEKFRGVAVSHNLCSADRKPLLTVRMYGDGFLNAREHKDKVMNHLKELGYVFESKIQEEFSIYDTNSSIDKGWLITN